MDDDKDDQQDEATTVTSAPQDYKAIVAQKQNYEKKYADLQSQLSIEKKKRSELHQQIVELKDQVKQNSKMIDM